MNTIKLTTLISGGMCLLVLGACHSSASDVAQTTAAPSAAKTPHEVCNDETVTTEKPVKDKDRVLGTVAGALVGGVVGHEVGGKGVATIGGAAAGGYAGNRVQKSVQDNATQETTKRVCHTVYE